VRHGKGAIQFKEGGNLVGPPAMTPCCHLPQSVMGDCGEVIIRPATFSFCNGLSQCFDGIFARLALDGSDSSEGGLTV